jgi:hypothetical protein
MKMSMKGYCRSAAAMMIVAGGLAAAQPPSPASAGQACVRSKRYAPGPSRQGIPSDPCIKPKDRAGYTGSPSRQGIPSDPCIKPKDRAGYTGGVRTLGGAASRGYNTR